jgi:BirA family transcriptional regulator, biotin operon repressor / biotin---[acetyl-CoA-carboxylase] ligase
LKAFLGLGSNLGDRLGTLTAGVRHLASNSRIHVEALSSIYETAPVGYLAQPEFLNAVLRLRTDLDPLELLDACQEAEQSQGRTRSFPNAPRTLDVDLLSCEREEGEPDGPGPVVLSTPRLTLPHVRAAERDFVRIPLAELHSGCTGRAPGIEPWLWGWDPLGVAKAGPGTDFLEEGSDLEPHRLVKHVFAGARFPTQVRYLRDVGSTNEEARRLALAGAPDGTVVLAEAQTEGRGRNGRTWTSAAGLGVWMTVLLRPAGSIASIGLVPAVAAIAVCRALRRLGAVDAGIKWPNDILCRDRKMAGILCESASSGGFVEWVAVGIGIDVLHGPGDLPSGIETPAVSLRMCREESAPGAGSGELRARLTAAVLYELEETVRMLSTGATRQLMEEYRRDSLVLGREVRVRGSEGAYDALATGIDDQGRLLVEAAGGVHALDSGDVTVRTVQEGTSS